MDTPTQMQQISLLRHLQPLKITLFTLFKILKKGSVLQLEFLELHYFHIYY